MKARGRRGAPRARPALGPAGAALAVRRNARQGPPPLPAWLGRRVMDPTSLIAKSSLNHPLAA
eukprot:12007924-Alexandrium_andersonii.AAC.1